MRTARTKMVTMKTLGDNVTNGGKFRTTILKKCQNHKKTDSEGETKSEF